MNAPDAADVERVVRSHAREVSRVSLNSWLDANTISRLREWTPAPREGEATLLDIGFYQPAAGYYVALGWQRIWGIAKEAGECANAGTYRTAEGADVSTILMDVERDPLPFADGSTDVVLMMEVFEHLVLDPMHALCEVNRVLKPGGRLVLSTPNATALSAVLRLLRGRSPYLGLEFAIHSTNRHNRIYDAEELRECLSEAGFDIEVCASRTYLQPQITPLDHLLKALLVAADVFYGWKHGKPVQRSDYLFFVARRMSNVRTRYPRSLYVDFEKWPDWHEAISKPAVSVTPDKKSALARATQQ